MKFKRFFGGFLDIAVKRGAHDQRMLVEPVCNLFHLVEGPVQEIVGAFILGAIYDAGRVAASDGNLTFAEKAAFHHVGENDIGAGASCRQVDVRREFRRSLEQAGQHGCLGQRDVLYILAEIKLGRGCNAESAAAHIGTVEVKLEDFLLAEIAFKPEREKGFLDLAFDGALIGKKQVFGKLLRDGRAALNHAVGAHVLA